MTRPPCPHKFQGQAGIEFLVVFPALVLLVFGLIQFVLLYQVRATLNHATMLAARAGALHNGDKSEMRNALAAGLAPLFATEPTLQNYYGVALPEAIKQTAAISNLTTLTTLNPTRAAITDFGRARLDGIGGRELPNDTLNYRNSAPGSNSKLSVQDANIMHLRVSYCVRLVVPIIDRVIYAVVNAVPGTGASGSSMQDPFGTHGAAISLSCVNPLFRGPRIIIRSEAFVRMQSPFYESNL
jgi:hypothetical protein